MQISSLPNSNPKSLGKPTSPFPASNSILINSDRVKNLLLELKPLTLPFLDINGNIIQLWKTIQYGLVGGVLNSGKMTVIPKNKVINALNPHEKPEDLIHRLENNPLRKWDLAYNSQQVSLTIWPHLHAEGKIYANKSYQETKADVDRRFSNLQTEGALNKKHYHAAQREARGEVIKINPKDNEPFDHGNDVRESRKAAKNLIQDVKDRLKKDNLSPDERKSLEKVIVDTSKVLDKSNKFAPLVPKDKPSNTSQKSPQNPGEKQFQETLQKTGLTKSYNATHPDKPVPKGGGESSEIGGVGSRVAEIEGLFDSAESLFEFTHAFFVPMAETNQLPFTDEELHQILYELAMGIYVHDTLPFFSLHFNQEANLYPVIHPAYENTLVGQVFAMLDYDMKGYLNGGIFKESFVKQWSKNPVKLNGNNSLPQLIDLLSYSKLHLTGEDKNYLSVRIILKTEESGFLEEIERKTADLLGETFDKKHKSENPIFRDYTKFSNSFRIIAKQNKIQKAEHLFILDADFDVEYTISPDPEYKQALDEHYKLYGEYPQAYDALIRAYETIKEKIHDHMIKLPFCKKYFKMLEVINFFSYYFTTLKKHRKIPILPKVKLKSAGSPSLFPSLPLYNVRTEEIKFSSYEMFKTAVANNKSFLKGNLLTPINTIKANAIENFFINEFFNNIYKNASEVMRRELNQNPDEYKKIGGDLKFGDIFLNLFNQLKQQVGARINESGCIDFFLEHVSEFQEDKGILTLPIPTPLLILPSEQTTEEVEYGKKVVGGCGMKMHSLTIQKSPQGEEILNHISTKLENRAGNLVAFADDQSALPSGAMFQLEFDDMPLGLEQDRQEVAALFSDMIQKGSSVQTSMNKIVSLMTTNQEDTFLNKIATEDYSLFQDSQGRNLLHHAAMNDNVFFTEELLKKGFSSSAKDDKEYLPIHYAAMCGNILQLKMLLSNQPKNLRGTYLNSQNNQGATPLIVAIQNGQIEMVEFLCSQDIDMDVRLKDSYTILHCAIHTGNEKIFKLVLEKCRNAKSLINVGTHEGITPLMMACRWGISFAKELIQRGAEPELKAKNGKTALDTAIEKNDLALCELLFPLSSISFLTIETAIKKSSLEINRLLCTRKGYFEAKNSLGDSPLILSLRHANIPVALCQLEYIGNNIQVLTTLNRLKESAITFAALGTFYEILEVLLKAVPSILPAKELFKLLLKGGYHGENAFLENFFKQVAFNQSELQELLLSAVESGNYLAISKLLLPKGADLGQFKGPQNWKIEHYLAKYDALFLFKQRWVPTNLGMRDDKGKSLAYIAAENGSWRVLSFLLDCLKEEQNHQDDHHIFYGVLKTRSLQGVQLFLEKAQDPLIFSQPLDSKGTCAVHLAAQMKSSEILTLLHDKGAKLDATDLNGNDPLFYAIQCENLITIDFLLSQKVQIRSESIFAAAKLTDGKIFNSLIGSAKKAQKEEALKLAISKHSFNAFSRLFSQNIISDYQTENSLSPLLLACQEGQAQMLEIILSNLRFPAQQHIDGNNALHIACTAGYETCVKILLLNGFNVDQLNNLGQTPAELAIKHAHYACSAVLGAEPNYAPHLTKLQAAIKNQDLQSIIDSTENWYINTYFTLNISGKLMRGTPLHLILKTCKDCPTLGNAVSAICKDKRFDPSLIDDHGNSYAHLMVEAKFDPTQIKTLNLNDQNSKGKTPLHLAAKGDNSNCLNRLISALKPKDFEQIDKEGRTPLFDAIIFKKRKHVKVLLKAGANVSHQDHNQLTPLMHACALGNYPMTRTLVKYKADMNQRGSLENIPPLTVSLKSKNEDISLFLLYEGTNLNLGIKDFSFAHPAAQSGKNSILRFLSAKGKSLISYDDKGLQPIHHAAIHGRIKTLDLFDSIGISLESLVHRAANSEEEEFSILKSATPLHLASMLSTLETVKWLLAHGADPEKITDGKLNTLASALLNTSSTSKDLLLLFKEYLLSKDLKQIFPAIEVAISKDSVEPLKTLYSFGLSPHTELSNNANGLHYACKSGSLLCTEFFLGLGVDWKIPLKSGETVFELSAMNKSIEQFRFLMKQLPFDLDHQNQKGETLIHLSTRAGNLAHVAFLIDEGADYDIQDAQGQTPLLIAAESGFKEIVELLMLYGADLTLKTTFSAQDPLGIAKPELKETILEIKKLQEIASPGGTPLHIAVTRDHPLAIRLLARHVDVNQQNCLGQTALHQAVLTGSLRTVRELLNNGAIIGIMDENGHNPLDLAHQDPRLLPIVQFLSKIHVNNEDTTCIVN